MRSLILNDVSRCRGELMGDEWGNADRICPARDNCKRHLQIDLDKKRDDLTFVSMSGWACHGDTQDMMIPIEEQVSLL